MAPYNVSTAAFRLLDFYFSEYECSVTQSCPTLDGSMDCGLPGHGISQARILQWVAISCSRGQKLNLIRLLRWQVESLLVSITGLKHVKLPTVNYCDLQMAIVHSSA